MGVAPGQPPPYAGTEHQKFICAMRNQKFICAMRTRSSFVLHQNQKFICATLQTEVHLCYISNPKFLKKVRVFLEMPCLKGLRYSYPCGRPFPHSEGYQGSTHHMQSSSALKGTVSSSHGIVFCICVHCCSEMILSAHPVA